MNNTKRIFLLRRASFLITLMGSLKRHTKIKWFSINALTTKTTIKAHYIQELKLLTSYQDCKRQSINQNNNLMTN